MTVTNALIISQNASEYSDDELLEAIDTLAIRGLRNPTKSTESQIGVRNCMIELQARGYQDFNHLL